MDKALFRDVGNYTNWCGDIWPEEMYFTFLNLAGNGLATCRGTSSYSGKNAVWAEKEVKYLGTTKFCRCSFCFRKDDVTKTKSL